MSSSFGSTLSTYGIYINIDICNGNAVCLFSFSLVKNNIFIHSFTGSHILPINGKYTDQLATIKLMYRNKQLCRNNHCVKNGFTNKLDDRQKFEH